MRNAILPVLRPATVALGLASALLIGCGDETTSDNTSVGDAGETDASGTDTGTTDAGTGGTDAATDTGETDAATDATTDTGETDAATDTSADAEMDGGETDAEMDAEMDATTDTGETDAGADVAPDVPGPVCGDGTVDDGEGCDDGNTDDGDGCTMFCEVCEDDAIASSGTSEESYEVDYGSSVEGVVAQAGLDDWYQVLLLPGCMAVFDVTYDTELGDVSIVLLDAARMELATSEPTDTGATLEWMSDAGGFFASTLFIGVIAETDGACVDYTFASVRRCG